MDLNTNQENATFNESTACNVPWWRRLDWTTTLFLVLTPLAALTLIPVFAAHFEFNPWTLGFAFFYWIACSMCITAGYHRLYSHRAFDAATWFKIVNLFVGAGAFQGSALKWCTDHRRHHRKVDSMEDPYTIARGFWYAHVGWLFLKDDPKYKDQFAPDLLKDRWVKFQHDHYVSLAIFFGFGVPTLLGWAYGDAVGGFLLAGVARVVVGHHTTFFINSLAHMWGRQTYSDQVSARDNAFLAVVTNGEGYHNFHHTFEADYRNGIRWYHWDPTKWLIRFLALFGQTYRLKRVPPQTILAMRLQMEQKRLAAVPIYQDRLNQLRQQIERAQKRWRELKDEYAAMKANLTQTSHERMIQIKTEMRLARIEFQKALEQWAVYVRAARSLTPASPGA